MTVIPKHSPEIVAIFRCKERIESRRFIKFIASSNLRRINAKRQETRHDKAKRQFYHRKLDDGSSVRPNNICPSSPESARAIGITIARVPVAMLHPARASLRQGPMKLIIGNKAYSSWSLRGWLACKQSGLLFEEAVVPLYDAEWDKRREGDEFAPSSGKVPILWDGDAVV